MPDSVKSTFAVNTSSSLSSTRSKNTCPHGLSGVAPSRLVNFIDAGEKSAGLTRLSTNGARSAICLPPLHSGDAMPVKSPASMAGVGMNWKFDVGTRRTRVR